MQREIRIEKTFMANGTQLKVQTRKTHANGEVQYHTNGKLQFPDDFASVLIMGIRTACSAFGLAFSVKQVGHRPTQVQRRIYGPGE